MAYKPIDTPVTWDQRDSAPLGSAERTVKGSDFYVEFSNIEAEFNDQRTDIDTAVADIATVQTEVDDLKTVAQKSQILASCKYNGKGSIPPQYGFNVSEVTELGNGFYRVNFTTPINADDGITLPDGTVVNPGDFAAVVTPYTTNNAMVIATITDQRERYIDIVFKQLSGSSWVAPPEWNGTNGGQGFAMILVDQVPG